MDIVMPQLGETVAEGTLTIWHKKPGERIEPGEVLFEVETDKVDTEVPAPAAGVLTEILVEEGETVVVGTRIGILQADGEEASVPVVAEMGMPAPKKRETESVTTGATEAPPPLSPVVSRLLAEHGLTPADVVGTGSSGRIKKKDVEAYVAVKKAVGAVAPSADGADRNIVPFNKIRKRTAEHMVASKATSPHVLQAIEVDFHRVAALRATMGAEWKTGEGFSLTWLPFIASAVCRAIADFPHVNASVDGESLVVWRDVHLGVAVDLGPDGLVAPVIRTAGGKSVADLARAINDLSSRARAGALTADDVSGGTYTLSNSGSFGTLITAPIINQPQVAILSTDGISKKPVVIESASGDSIVVRPVGIIAQSFDHRAIDGAYSAGFLKRVKELIEDGDWSDIESIR
jgi:pyruvate/2-oxoglutarate dehydrogenase complex dihydrolipoamide acyltransferase (E2) component